jgi:6,7-dimethyl-8-ribityllumazine synthase
MSKGISFGKRDGSKLRIGIVKTEWNETIVENLFLSCRQALLDTGVLEKQITIIDVPGSFELPMGAKILAKKKKFDAIICLGVLIKGDTMHFEYIAEAVSHGLMTVGLESSTPVIFGVLTCLNEEQAIVRATGENNHGYWWGKSAVEMALIKKGDYEKK